MPSATWAVYRPVNSLDPIFASLTLTGLQQLNARIAVDGEEPDAVARVYLKSHHFLP